MSQLRLQVPMPPDLWQGNSSGGALSGTTFCRGGLAGSVQVEPRGHVLPCRGQGGGQGYLPAHRGEDCWRGPQDGPCLQPAQASACSLATLTCWQAQAGLPHLSLPDLPACTSTWTCLLPSQLVLGTASAAGAEIMHTAQISCCCRPRP